jgi:chromosome segregation ATPase
MRSVTAILIAFVLGGLAVLVWSGRRASELADLAEAEAARAHGLALDRQAAERRAEAARGELAATRAELHRVRDSVDVVRTESRVRSDKAAQAAEALEARLRGAATDPGAVAAILDTLRTAHASQVRALEDEVDALDQERRILWRQVEAQDTALARLEDVNRALRAELVSWQLQAETWKRAARPGLVVRVGRGLKVAGPAFAAGWILASR